MKAVLVLQLSQLFPQPGKLEVEIGLRTDCGGDLVLHQVVVLRHHLPVLTQHGLHLFLAG